MTLTKSHLERIEELYFNYGFGHPLGLGTFQEVSQMLITELAPEIRNQALEEAAIACQDVWTHEKHMGYAEDACRACIDAINGLAIPIDAAIAQEKK